MTSEPVSAALAAAGAVALLLSGAGSLPVTALTPRAPGSETAGRGARPRRPRRAAAVGLMGLVTGLLVARVGVPVSALALAGCGAGATAGGVALWRRRAARLAAVRSQGRVLDLTRLLGAELAAGRSTGTALAQAAREWPALDPVLRAHELGGDVPAALRALAAEPGCGDLRLVAGAWQVAHRSGTGLAAAMERVGRSVRAAEATRRVVRSELASARATARLLAGLPLLALLMGDGVGGDPVGFLVGHPVGIACLAVGLGLGLAGLWWIEAIADGVEGSRR